MSAPFRWAIPFSSMANPTAVTSPTRGLMRPAAASKTTNASSRSRDAGRTSTYVVPSRLASSRRRLRPMNPVPPVTSRTVPTPAPPPTGGRALAACATFNTLARQKRGDQPGEGHRRLEMRAVAGALDDLQASSRDRLRHCARLVHSGQCVLRADDHQRAGIDVLHHRGEIELAIAVDVAL